MSSPKIIVNILVSTGKALGKAFYEAGRQAAKNVNSSPQGALSSDVAGVGRATSGSITDQLTRQHRMTLDEAQLILNIKKDTPLEQVIKNHDHLFKANSPPPKPEKPISSKHAVPTHSHYLQSKVVRALERWQAEMKAAGEGAFEKPPSEPPTTPPPAQS